MTTDKLAPDNQPSGITLPMFIIFAAVIIAGAMTAIWFALPGPDNLHRLVSPSGTRVIELGELCTGERCNRVAILDVTQLDGSHVRTACPLAPSSLTPLFANVTATWSLAEDRLYVAYAAASGPTGTLSFVLAECTQTE